MFRRDRSQGLWARKRRLIGTSFAVVLGVAFLAATLVLGDTMRKPASTRRSPTPTPASTSSCAAPTRSAPATARVARRHRRLDRRRRSPPSPACAAAVPHGRRRRPRCSAPTATASAATVRRPTGTNWIDDPDLNPYHLAEGRAPAGPRTRSSSTAAPREHGDLHVGDTHHRADADARRGHDRRHRHVRRRRQPRPDDLHGVHAAAGERAVRPAARTRSRRSSWPPRTASARRRCASEITEQLPARDRGADASRADGRAERRDRRRLPRHVLDDPAGVRRHRARRRHVQHPQHVLDPRGPADP